MSGLLRTRSASFRGVADANRTPGGGRAGVAHTLERDGAVLPFYHALVKINRRVGASLAQPEERHQCPLPIPDTVVYERNFPQGWFTYDHRDRVVLQRPGKTLDAGSIVDTFRACRAGSGGICAQFVATHDDMRAGRSSSTSPTHDDGYGDGNTSPRPASGGYGSSRNLLAASPVTSPRPAVAAHDLCVEFFTPDTLADFVFGRGVHAGRNKHGILQVFVPPRSSHNDSLEIVWSPCSCAVTRCVNSVSITSHAPDVRLKGSTLDGPPHLCDTAVANPLLHREMKAAAKHLAENLLRHEHKVVSRIVLLCKQDPRGRLWLLYATSLRTAAASDVVATRKPRVPLNFTAGYNFTSSLREVHGTSADQLATALAHHVEMGEDGERGGGAHVAAGTVIAYRSPSADGTSRRRVVGYRIVPSSGDTAPLITGPTLAPTPSPPRSGRPSRRPSTSLASHHTAAPVSVADAVEATRQHLTNLLYQLGEARSYLAGGPLPTPLVVAVPAEVEACLGSSDMVREVYALLGMAPRRAAEPSVDQTVDFTPAATATDAPEAQSPSMLSRLTMIDLIAVKACEAARRAAQPAQGMGVRRGGGAALLVSLALEDELRKATPVAKVLGRLDSILPTPSSLP